MSEIKLQPEREIKAGTRVRTLAEGAYVKKGATGTADETSIVPYVIWDSDDMLTERARRKGRRWPIMSQYLEEITPDPDALEWRDLTQDEMRVVIAEVLAHGTNNGLDAFNTKIREILAK